jgi:dynein regulatory complex protein 1
MEMIDAGRVKVMLELLAEGAGFLVEPKVREALASLPEGLAQLTQAESLLRALGVSNEAELRTLLGYFVREPGPGEGAARGEGEEEEEEEEDQLADSQGMLKSLQASTALSMIMPDDVIGAVRRFVEDRKEGQAGARPTSLEDR